MRDNILKILISRFFLILIVGVEGGYEILALSSCIAVCIQFSTATSKLKISMSFLLCYVQQIECGIYMTNFCFYYPVQHGFESSHQNYKFLQVCARDQ